MKLSAIVAPLVLAAASNAMADARINFQVAGGDGAGLQSFQVGHGKLRADVDAGSSLILDPAARTFTVLDHAERTYLTLGESEIKQLSATIGNVMSQMEQAMANLPPEVRAQLGDVAAGGVAGLAGDVKVVDTGTQDTVGGHACTVYRTQMNGKTVNETCMGSLSALDGLSASDRETLESAMRVSESMIRSLAQGPLAGLAESTPFKAGMVPLRVVDFENGRRGGASEFSGVDNGSLSKGVFEVPSGYSRQKLEMPGLNF